ncbi:MAG TPA: CPBP family intramembrane glutamic endopeptidase [Vicinamibacterales bacterium]|nr:CPBP family intramembrane glutamic endopeptidase [Vicinamibacterales bacterium]
MTPKLKRNVMVFLVLAGGAMWIPVAQALFGRPPGFLRDLGFLSGPSGTFVAWSGGFAIAGLYSAYAVRRIPLVRQYWRAVCLVKFVGVLAAISAAVVEEAFFRRFLMDALLRVGWPDALQVIASGVVFGIAHASWALVTGHVAVGVGAMMATGTLGTGLALVYILGDRSLAPVIVAHFMVTATIQPGIMFAAFSGQMRQQVTPPQHAA